MVGMGSDFDLRAKTPLSATQSLAPTPQEVAPRFIDKQIVPHKGREGGNFLYFSTKLSEYSTPPKGRAFTIRNGTFIARHDYCVGVFN